MKIKKEILSFIIIVIISSCNIEDFSEEISFDVLGINKDEIYYGETLIVYYQGSLLEAYQAEIVSSTDTLDIKEFFQTSKAGQLVFTNQEIEGNYQLIISNDQEKFKYDINFYAIPNLETIEITSGTFILGNEIGFADERPINKVLITNGIVASKYEITNSIWELVNDDPTVSGKAENLPVSNVEWIEAIEFCNKLSQIYKLSNAYSIDNNDVVFNQQSNGWRLPTEAEWEYLAKAGKNLEFSGAIDPTDVTWYNANSGFNPQVVGTKLPNEWGLYDLNGNLLEWCWDYYSDYSISDSLIVDPKGPETGTRRVRRGGAYNFPISYCRSTSRNFISPSLENTGFRIVRNN